MTESAAALTALGVLADPTRRRLYEYVVAQHDAVSREQAAAGAAVPTHSARFHLDRLVEAGLLDTEERRTTGRTGPGAGRPAKCYRRSSLQVEVSVPQRSYELVGAILAAAVQRCLAGAEIGAALAEEARGFGRADGAAQQRRGSALDRAASVLSGRGFEPTEEAGGLLLHNCPFDALAHEHAALVCGLNHDYVGGVVEGLRCRSLEVRLDPGEDRCCVLLSGR